MARPRPVYGPTDHVSEFGVAESIFLKSLPLSSIISNGDDGMPSVRSGYDIESMVVRPDSKLRSRS
jgi:hypothetical protein